MMAKQNEIILNIHKVIFLYSKTNFVSTIQKGDFKHDAFYLKYKRSP